MEVTLTAAQFNALQQSLADLSAQVAEVQVWERGLFIALFVVVFVLCATFFRR